MNLLLIAPHADDAEFFAGGLIQRIILQGGKAHVAVMGMSTGMVGGKMVDSITRRVELQAASEILGYTYSVNQIQPENMYADNSYGLFVAAIEREIKVAKPDLLVIPLPTFNQDHRRVYEACMTALRPHRIFEGRVWGAEYPGQGWAQGQQHVGEFTGRVYVPLTEEQMQRKVDALTCHKSQMTSLLMGRNGATILAQMRGLECGVSFAEMFVPLREVF